MLDEHEGRGADVGEHPGERQPHAQHVAQRATVAEQPPIGEKGLGQAAAAALRRVAFGDPPDRQQAEPGEQRQDHEQRAPAGPEHQVAAEQRRGQRCQHGHHVHQCQHPGGLAQRIEVAHHDRWRRDRRRSPAGSANTCRSTAGRTPPAPTTAATGVVRRFRAESSMHSQARSPSSSSPFGPDDTAVHADASSPSGKSPRRDLVHPGSARAWLLSRADNVNRLTKCAEGERFQVGFALQRRTLHDRQAWKGTEASEASGRIANTSLTS